MANNVVIIIISTRPSEGYDTNKTVRGLWYVQDPQRAMVRTRHSEGYGTYKTLMELW